MITMAADRIYVACGGIGTTRLVMGSLELFDQNLELAESVQIVMPEFRESRLRQTPRDERDFTLNEFNLVYDASGDAFDLCQIHFYPYNPVFETSLPSFLRVRCQASGDSAPPQAFRWLGLLAVLGISQGQGECKSEINGTAAGDRDRSRAGVRLAADAS